MQLHAYFTDGAVLQADEEVIVRGSCSKGVEVFARLDGERPSSASCRADGEGKFALPLGRFPHGFSAYTLTVVCGKEQTVVKDILFGDVFLALGQSNMEYRLKMLRAPEAAFIRYGGEEFRFLDVENVGVRYDGGICGPLLPRSDFAGEPRWGRSSDRAAAFGTFGFSYLFCGELQQKAGYPVACVNLAVGGSHIVHWLPREIIQTEDALAIFRDSLPVRGEEGNAGCIYNEKMAPLKGFAFKGILWYLGESVAWDGYEKTLAYADAFHAMLERYRSELRGELSVLLMDIGIEPYGEFNVNYLNEQNALICAREKGVVQCPIFDLPQSWIAGRLSAEDHPIHLVEKEEHVHRAVRLVYENFLKKRELRCPRIVGAEFFPHRALLHTDACSPLTAEGEPFGFALAGGDGRFVEAEAALLGTDIEVTSPYVSEPRRVSYAFFLYNDLCNVKADGLPLLPYRENIERAEEGYARFNPAFRCTFEKGFESSFSALAGGAGYRDTFSVSSLFGDRSAKLSFSAEGVTLSMKSCPEEAGFAGICPNLLAPFRPHCLGRYEYLSVRLRAERDLEFTGVHFRTCEGEPFYLVPRTDGKEARNLLLEGGKETELKFDLGSALDKMEQPAAFPPEKREKIALMQLTFRNFKPENSVLVRRITLYHEEN